MNLHYKDESGMSLIIAFLFGSMLVGKKIKRGVYQRRDLSKEVIIFLCSHFSSPALDLDYNGQIQHA